MKIDRNFKMLIDGEFVEGSSGKRFSSVNPATGEEWTTIPEASEEDTDRAVKAAWRAFSEGPWSKTTAHERGQYLRKLGALIEQHGEELARIETTDTGKLFKETAMQARRVSRNLDYYAGLADKVQGDTLPSEFPNSFSFTLREPLGVVAGVIPWNTQLPLTIAKLAPALAAGNTIVLKASEHASAPLLAFGQIVQEAGFPAGVINVLAGFGEPTGRVLTAHPLVSRIAFTGGVETARHIVRNSAENFAQISLELGGKSPVLLFEDADLDMALNGVLGGIFAASGQSCVAGSRLYVHEKVADAFLAKLTERMKSITIGDPMDPATQMGPLATQRQLDLIESSLAEAKEQGVRILAGGHRPANLAQGQYFEPTVVEAADNSPAIVDRELFGPVLTVIRFSDEAKVVELANDTQFGFACAIYTRDLSRSMRLMRLIRCGVVWVNTHRILSAMSEYGGIKNTGYGREGGVQSIYDYTRTKLVWINTSATAGPDPLR